MTDEGMDRNPDPWASPQYPVTFPEPQDAPPVIEDAENPYGAVHFADADAMHNQMMSVIEASNAALARIIRILSGVGLEIIRLDAGAVAASQHIRFRVQYLILDRATAGDGILTVGTGTYTFTTDATPRRVDFPLVIDRGVDMLFTGDGRCYLVGQPE